MQKPLTPEQLKEAADAYLDNGRVATRAAEALGLHTSTFDNRLRQAKLKGFVPDNPGPGFEIKQESVRYNADGEEIGRTVTSKPEAGEEFKVPEGYSIKGESALVGPDGRVNAKWIKTDRDVARGEALVEAIHNSIKGLRSAKAIKPPKHCSREITTVYPLPDLHCGQLSWKEETGSAYDVDIACKGAIKSIQSLVGRSPKSEVAVLSGIGDLLHADDSTSRTPGHKHKLDTADRHQRVMTKTLDMMYTLVTVLASHHKRIVIRILRGNHDPHAGPSLLLAMAGAFRDTPRVSVELDPATHQFYRFHQNLIGFTHGDTVKQEALPMLMANERQSDWGEVDHKTFFSGHKHHLKSIDIDGVWCHQLPAAAHRDAYTASGGWFSSRGLMCFVYHKDEGEKSRHSERFPAKPRAVA